MEKGFAHVFVLIAIVAMVIALYLTKTNTNLVPIALLTPTPTPYQFPYKNPEIPKNQSYRIVIVGDSIVYSLGPNANVLRLALIALYPDSEFVTYNYGHPSTNILSLPDRLAIETKTETDTYPPILEQGFELIIIDSFGYNPPSELALADGLAKQNEILEESVRLILKEKPGVSVAFMTPIALSRDNFARSTRDLSSEVREAWVDERVAYIENHKKFAQSKGIPIIDVFEASLKPNGEVDESYISNDFVHPSIKGIELMSREIANYIFDNKIFPQ